MSFLSLSFYPGHPWLTRVQCHFNRLRLVSLDDIQAGNSVLENQKVEKLRTKKSSGSCQIQTPHFIKKKNNRATVRPGEVVRVGNESCPGLSHSRSEMFAQILFPHSSCSWAAFLAASSNGEHFPKTLCYKASYSCILRC